MGSYTGIPIAIANLALSVRSLHLRGRAHSPFTPAARIARTDRADLAVRADSLVAWIAVVDVPSVAGRVAHCSTGSERRYGIAACRAVIRRIAATKAPDIIVDSMAPPLLVLDLIRSNS